MKTKLPLIPLAAVSLLLIPLIAMQFTDEVKWTAIDFITMGALLLITGTGIELIRRRNNNVRKRMIYIAICIIVFLLIWVELAVGI